ncbi:RNA-binding domain-containing protein [Pluteus cervinus]|uniref:RNA-binding domain-containing protein n=1 Tax=Pluteus cervinus TaxID=181527 RepID=A0ACD3AWD7_9AGAR|nr:RNA-binding domain-containing protein [Pluteus cervinus]
MVTDETNWSATGNGRSPGRDRNGDAPRRSSRSRSPGGRGRQPDGSTNPGNNLYVSGLSHKVDTRDLEAAFAKVGRVKKASVTYDPHTRESRGFGFVTMETAEEAEAAVTALNSTDLMGKVCTVEKARRARARTPTPGRYYGPPKRAEHERPYDPRPYDSRYTREHDDRRRSRHDDHRGGRDYDRGYRDYDRDRGGGGGGYRESRDYDRRYDDRRY